MALYAFDGTWKSEKDNDVEYDNTNVCRFYEAYKATSGTHDVYEKGIGTRFSGVPVVDSDGTVIGLVSSSDVLCAIEQALDEDRDEGEPEDLLERLHAVTAGDIATPEVIWVSPDTPIAEVAQLMRTEGIHRVLVGTRERLDGVLTAYDLLGGI